MEYRAVIDVSGYTRFNPDSRHPAWWGVVGLVAIEAMVFGSFLVSFLYLRIRAAEWPPAGVSPPPLLYPSINVVLLLGSATSMYLAGRAMKGGNRRALVVGVGISLLLALVVLVLRWLQFKAFAFSWSDHAYGSIIWTVTGLHFTHVVATVLGTAVVWILGIRGYWTRERQIGVVADALYWYFVALVWVPVYLVLYWTDRLAGGG